MTSTKKLILAGVFLFFAIQIAVSASNSCFVDLKDEEKGVHVVVDGCKNIGTFSIGGLYNGNWEKLTYFYPSPWEGTFLSIKVNDKVYSNSANPDEKILMNNYVTEYPSVSGNKISTRWKIPEGIVVEQVLEITEEAVLIHVKTTNENSNAVNLGLRLHLDTMLGDNDGAPIYIPGDGLKTKETEYSFQSLNFKYWKAYNRQEDPTIIATGILDGNLNYPDRVIVANWKKSMHSSWSYDINPETPITGDSAVIIYYNEKPLAAGSVREVTTVYGIGKPILPALISFGIADVVTDRITGVYCPGEVAGLGVDVANTGRFNESGQVKLIIKDKNNLDVYGANKGTGVMGPDSVQSIKFAWIIPKNISGPFIVDAQLFKESLIDEKILVLTIDPSQCAPEEKGLNLLFLGILAVLIAMVIFLLVYPRITGFVDIKKVLEGNTVKVTVLNRSKNEIRNCVIEDRIGGAEVHVKTIGVRRIGDTLTMNVEKLEPGEGAILEYNVRGINVLPRAKVRWDGGERISN